MLYAGCITPRAVPDPTIPHRLSRDATVTVWVRAPNGRLVETKVRAAAGWWIASPAIVEGAPK